MGLVRNDNGHGLLSFLCGVYTQVVDQVAGFVDRFEAFEGNVLEQDINLARRQH